MKSILILSLFLITLFCNAQDERLFRDMITGELTKDRQQEAKSTYKYKVRTDRYRVDLDEDGRSESFFVSKKDGEDWIQFFNYADSEIFRYRFDTLGPLSRVFKVNIRKISKTKRACLIYFYEGANSYLEFKGTTRLYVLTFDIKKMNRTITMFKGPNVWLEWKGFKGNYHQRKSEVTLVDFDDDGTREIAVRYNLITRVYRLRSDNHWQEIGELTEPTRL